MNIVSFGGGTNSTAMIIGMYLHKIPIDLILFADTGGEQPHTYEFMGTFNEWLVKHGIPKIVSVEYHDKDGNRLTLEQECINSGRLPSIAYGYKNALSSTRSGRRRSSATTINRAKRCGPAASASTNTSVTMPGRHGASNTPRPSTKRTKSTKSIKGRDGMTACELCALDWLREEAE